MTRILKGGILQLLTHDIRGRTNNIMRPVDCTEFFNSTSSEVVLEINLLSVHPFQCAIAALYKLVIILWQFSRVAPRSEPVLSVRVERQVNFRLIGNFKNCISHVARFDLAEGSAAVVKSSARLVRTAALVPVETEIAVHV